MLENAHYSVISPRGMSTIRWKDDKHLREAAAALRGDAQTALRLGIINGIISEPKGGAKANYDKAAELLADTISLTLAELMWLPPDLLVKERRARFRDMGVYYDGDDLVGLKPQSEEAIPRAGKLAGMLKVLGFKK